MIRPALDPYDHALLRLLHEGLPLDRRPFAAVAASLGAHEDEVLADVRRLVADGWIAAVAPVFAAGAFGLHPTLVAATVAVDDLGFAERVLARHPGVSHLVVRDHAFSCWFTIAIDPGSQLGLAGTLEVLGRLLRAGAVRALPARREVFRRRAGDWRELAEQLREPRGRPASPGELDRAVVRATQDGLPVAAEPFAVVAAALGTRHEALLAHLQAMRRDGRLVRLGALLPDGDARGAPQRLLTGWAGAEPRRLARALAREPAAQVCIERATHPDWPYALLASFAGDDPAALAAALQRVEGAVPPATAARLPTVRSVKLRRLLFAPEEHAAWERSHVTSGEVRA